MTVPVLSAANSLNGRSIWLQRVKGLDGLLKCITCNYCQRRMYSGHCIYWWYKKSPDLYIS